MADAEDQGGLVNGDGDAHFGNGQVMADAEGGQFGKTNFVPNPLSRLASGDKGSQWDKAER